VTIDNDSELSPAPTAASAATITATPSPAASAAAPSSALGRIRAAFSAAAATVAAALAPSPPYALLADAGALARAARLHMRSAALGNTYAELALGHLLWEGRGGLNASRALAIARYTAACTGRLPEGCFALGWAYETGPLSSPDLPDGPGRDLPLAKRYYDLALAHQVSARMPPSAAAPIRFCLARLWLRTQLEGATAEWVAALRSVVDWAEGVGLLPSGTLEWAGILPPPPPPAAQKPSPVAGTAGGSGGKSATRMRDAVTEAADAPDTDTTGSPGAEGGGAASSGSDADQSF
jgi:hypothetical protein